MSVSLRLWVQFPEPTFRGKKAAGKGWWLALKSLSVVELEKGGSEAHSAGLANLVGSRPTKGSS